MTKISEANRRMKYRLVSYFLHCRQAYLMRDWSWNRVIQYILNNAKRSRQKRLVWNLEQNGIYYSHGHYLDIDEIDLCENSYNIV